jgi:hypothetical protein
MEGGGSIRVSVGSRGPAREAGERPWLGGLMRSEILRRPKLLPFVIRVVARFDPVFLALRGPILKRIHRRLRRR